ncbi:hemerythrin domain-containing protein [Variovorax ginsengisoli]|jgi:hemerythrin-like domain-containing protein|uniref:Hemerythrin domain-containing protein n=1 Tax=Variovorax ginsengisoli TaxID=363844 RepID=A0ABT8S735_9BURK|nr:hemerythrin domain-containing protein [Variovorax ginsengisoli]MDN8614924.1 hemerythrin domain-containing protein [Variovorax ginsengisoli]MDO1534094.1 hemerythrin domain-containing protein [Variovorax ginsengisoli]
MLAAECAWAVLRAEHARIRELLNLVNDALNDGAWVCSSPQAKALSALIARLQAFDHTTHRPKGVVLVQTLRGRSVEADDLLLRLESTRDCCDDLLLQAMARLRAASSGAASVAEGVGALLHEHRRLMLVHLDEEDSLLHSQTAAHLTREEWAAVASSISVAMGQARA